MVLGDASGGLVDIDLDSDTARKLAPYFLPPTGWIFGRESAPRSHRVYKISGEAGRGLMFDAGGKFAEYRADGQMTVSPPSIHPSGEAIEFAEHGEPGTATRVALMNSLSLMAICGVVVPCFVEGKRNEIVLSLSGTPLTHGKSEREVLRIVEVLCEATGDLEKTNRLDVVRATSARKSKGEPFKQKRHLADLLGDHVAHDLSRYLSNGERLQTSFEAPWIGALSRDDQNDTGVAKLFAAHVKERVLFDQETARFQIYHKGIWGHDPHALKVTSELDKFINDQVAQLRTSMESVSDEQCASQIKFLLRYRNRVHVRNVIEQSRPFLRAETGRLDRHNDMIPVRNGIVKLQDGTLTPLMPEHYVTKCLDVDHDPMASCPLFKKVLSDAFGGDDDLIAYFKGIMGYWLTGNADRQEFYILHGSGANGKSTILSAITHVLGPYAGNLMSETIFEGSSGQHNSDLASMRNYRLAVVHEAESKFRLNAARIKQITGEDWIKVKALYQDPTSFRPNFKVVVVCNKRPKSRRL